MIRNIQKGMGLIMGEFDKRVPKEYYEPIENCGTIEPITYQSKRYATDMSDITKRALVYLPYGFDANSGKEYKTLYLMHGGGGNEEEFLYGQEGKKALLYIIDHMIADGILEPLIIVTPTFYYDPCQSVGHDIAEAGILTGVYPQEFRNELLPYIEAHYPVLKGRENRAFSGFSMGGKTTWEIMMDALDLVKHFMPLSGDCWIAGEKGGSKPETIELMAKRIKDNGFADLDYNVFAFTGDQDIAFPALDGQMKNMLAAGWNGNGNQVRYGSWAEGVHWYPWIYEYMYNIMPVLF